MRSGVIVIAIASFVLTGETPPIAPTRVPAAVPTPSGSRPSVPRVPPQLPDAPRAGLVVRVTSEGQPIADAEVQLADGSDRPPVIARTDREGAARYEPDLGPGPFEAWAVSGDRASPIARIGDLGGTLALSLEPASIVTGEVEADGGTLASGRVQLTPLDVDHAVRTTTLDARGRFQLTGIPHGRWRLEATSPGFLPSGAQEIRIEKPVETVGARLERTAIVAGAVVDRRGEPVPNATIVVRRQGAHGARAAAPTFGEMRWVYPFATARQVPTNDGARFGASRPGSRPAECGDGHCGIDLVMPRGTTVHATGDGTVIVATTALGSEAGRFVAIDHGDGLVTMYMHLDQVRAGLEVGQAIRAGTPIGTVGSTGFDPTRSVPHLHFAITQHRGGRTWYLDPEAMLRRSVVLAVPRALDGAIETFALAPHAAAELPATETIVTDARGRFRAANLEPGTYVAVAFAPDLAPGSSAPFAVRSGEPLDGVVVTLEPGAIVSGRITTRNGPLAGATVIASTGFGETASKVATTTSNAQGEFTLRALSGTVTVAVSAPKYGETSRTIDLAGRDSSRADFSLVVEDATLRGLVRSPFGGVAGASVRIVEGPTRRSAVTDAAGQFTIQPVATGRYVLEVSSPDFPVRRLAIESDRFGEVRLEQGGGVRIRVGDAREGAGLAGIRVEGRGPDGAVAGRTSDARGIVDLAGLVPGAWTLVVRARGYVPVTREVEIRASRIPEDLRIDLAKSATLAGVVRDRRGTRVAGARVWSGTASTQSDADGNFRLTGVPIGAVELEASLGDHTGHVPLQLSAGDERVTLTIELADR